MIGISSNMNVHFRLRALTCQSILGRGTRSCALEKYGKSTTKSPKSSDTTAGKTGSSCTKSSNTAAAAGINITASETPFGIKDTVLRKLIGLGKVQMVTRSSRSSRSGK